MVPIRTAALLCCVVVCSVACISGERDPAQGENETATRTVLVTQPPPAENTVVEETMVVIEATGPAEASTKPDATPGATSPSPCGGTPEKILDIQYRHINEGEYEFAYAFFSDRSKALITPEQYRAYFEANAPYLVTDYSFPSVEVDGEVATVDVAFTSTSAGVTDRLYRTQELACELGSWRVVMRDEQVAIFAGIAPVREEEVQYEVPQYRSPETPSGSNLPPLPAGYGEDGGWTCAELGGGPYRVTPGSKHDRDKDGRACEARPGR